MDNKELIAFVAKASTKQQTELTGSHTLLFEDRMVFAYNNIIGIRAHIEYDIQGSVPADKFNQLIQKIEGETLKIQDTSEKLVIRYGKHSASLRKESKGLEMYKPIVFPVEYDLHPFPSDMLEGLSIMRFQNHKNKLSGVFIDCDAMYMINSKDIAVFTPSTSFDESFWIPREGVELLLNLPESKITGYSLSNSFLYVFTVDFDLALKLKIASQYKLDTIKKILSDKTDFSHYIEVPMGIEETLNRIQISTIKDSLQHMIFDMKVGEELTISSTGTRDTIVEYLPYVSRGVSEQEWIVPIDAFLTLLKSTKEGRVFVLDSKEGVFLASHSMNMSYFMKVTVKE
jgi:hypothetical protein